MTTIQPLWWGIVRVKGASYIRYSGMEYLILDQSDYMELIDKVFGVSARFIHGQGGVYDWLREQLKTPFLLADRSYYVPRIQPYQVEKWWGKHLDSIAKHGGYMLEVSDCDDFSSAFSSLASLELRTNSFAKLWGELCIPNEGCYGHAFNAVVGLINYNLEKKEAYIYVAGFEPQLNYMATPRDDGTFTIPIEGLGEMVYKPAAVLAW